MKKNYRKAQRIRADSPFHLYTNKIAFVNTILQKEVPEKAQPKATHILDYFRLNTLQ